MITTLEVWAFRDGYADKPIFHVATQGIPSSNLLPKFH